jgi:hypothetical protein
MMAGGSSGKKGAMMFFEEERKSGGWRVFIFSCWAGSVRRGAAGAECLTSRT